MIQEAREKLRTRMDELEKQKRLKEDLKEENEKEKQKIKEARDIEHITLQSLGKKERELTQSIREKESAAAQLQKSIEAIIAEEMRRLAMEANKTGAEGKPDAFTLTPAEVALSANFEDNRGKLPWPTERGIISGTFGEHPHPVLKGIKVKNNGIEIATSKGAMARSVFEGEVTRVINVPVYNYVVIIRHGEYLSVYSNLEEVLVHKGDQIRIKQVLGRIQTDAEKAKTELHFEIWKGKELLNPAEWIFGGM